MNYLSLSQQAAGFALALTVLTSAAHAQFGELSAGPLALAAPVSGIRVDGDLSDWPDDHQRLPLLNEFGVYGRTDLEGTDLTSSQDFNATMMVGYDYGEDMLYVAVKVYDDVLFMDGDSVYRDGIEIYVSDLSAGSSPVQHRVATSRDNPMSGNGGRWRNGGDHLAYEWRGAVVNEGRAVPLNEGTVIGFDVVAVDNDGQGNTAWVPWGPPVRGKFGGNDKVGRVLLAPSGLASGEMQNLATVLGAFNRSHEHGLQALEDHEAEFEQMIERLVEHNADGAGRHAAMFAARLATQIASAASASAIASAEASIAQMDTPPPPMAPVHRMISVTSSSDEDSTTSQVINILGACAMILAIGFTVSLIRRSGAGGGDDEGGPGATALEDRIAQIEARMTDTQDVMIALSEKLDRIDEGGSKGDTT